MSNLKYYVDLYLDKTGLNQKDLAISIGEKPNTFSQWVNDKRQPDQAGLIKISQILNVPIDTLLGNKITNSSPRRIARLPVLGDVAAGIPIEAITDVDDFEEIDIDEFEPGEYVGLRIKGDSMEPRMFAGDVVIVRVQATANDGDTAVILINGDEATCKKIKKTPDGIMLISNNPSYEPMFYSKKDIENLPVRIFGVVKELRGKY